MLLILFGRQLGLLRSEISFRLNNDTLTRVWFEPVTSGLMCGRSANLTIQPYFWQEPCGLLLLK